MKITYILLILLFIVASNSYGESSGTNDIKAFVKGCDSAYNLGVSICECLAKKAAERLTPDGFAFLVAVMNKDDKKAAELGGKLDMYQSMEAGMFMVNTPQECAEEMGGN